MSTFLLHTPLSQMRPVGSEGERSFARVTALVAKHLSERDAAILADPVPVRDGSGIDWYADVEGEVAPLADLPPEAATGVRARLAAILDGMRSAADRLDADGSGKQVTAATALRNAAIFPGDDYVFAAEIGGEWAPIIVGWGYESHDASTAREFQISGFGPSRSAPTAVPIASAPVRSQPEKSPIATDPAATPAVAAPAAEAARRGLGWGWLLPAIPFLVCLLLLGFVASLLLPACGLRTPLGTVSFGFPSSYGCGSVAAAVLAPPAHTALDEDLLSVKQEYLRQRFMCLANSVGTASAPIAPPLPETPAVPQTPQQQEEQQAFDDRVDQRGEAQITLIWEGPDDLDLSMRCPSGQVIQYTSARACGGNLDIDQNAQQISPTPVENITFPQGLQEAGDHRIFVTLYASRSNQFPLPFKVRIRDENGTRVLPGQLVSNKQSVVIGQVTK